MRSQIFEYDESSLVLLYNLYLNDDELVDQHQVYTGKEIQNNIDFDNIHFNSKTGVIRLNKAFASPYIIKSNIDNAISFLKEDAENSFIIFGNELWDKLIYKQEVQNSLSKSNDTLFDKEFYLVFQPKVDSKKNKVVGFEALSRWNHPTLGFISPEVFIPIAESKDLIIPLGWSTYEKAQQFIQSLYKEDYKDHVVSVNVSYAQIKEEDLVSKFIRLATEHRVTFRNIGIEITESILIDDFDAINKKIKMLKNKGISIYLDDFGVGYSSLERIKYLPIDYLKVDRSFAEMIETNPEMAKTIFTMVYDLNYKVIAKGIETETQKDWIEKIGDVVIQGFYFAKPMKEIDAIRYLYNNRFSVTPDEND